jgi:imidazolonepropionase-like amidohydrolase
VPSLRLDRDSRNARPLPAQQKDLDSQMRGLNEAFNSARAYARAKSSAGSGAAIDTDLRWEAMLPVLRGEQRVFVHADEVKQIRAALALARQQAVSIVLVGGLDAWQVAAELKAANVPVIISGTDRLPLRRDDDYEAAYANAARLHVAGVRFCIAGEGPGDLGKERNLGIHAARAAAHGLPPDVALRAVTLSAAELLGVASELGSVDAGKRATLIVTDGDPLEPTTRVQLAFIDGASVDLRSRHTQLYEKYHERLRRGRESRATHLPADGG